MNPLELIDTYCAGQEELKHILLTHSRQVADRALQIVDAHPELQADRTFVEEAAMLHDIGIVMVDAPRIFCHGTHKYIEHGYLGAEILRAEGYPRHAGVAERHTGSGITLEQVLREGLPLPPQDYCPRTLEEEIICYADKFYSKTHLGEELPYQRVRQSIWMYGNDAVIRFDKWREKFESNTGN